MSGLRNASGKFSLGSFGRKVSGLPDSPASPSRVNGQDADDFSPPRDGQSGGTGGSGGVAFDGIGKKLGKSLAHQSLLPSLGNQDLRALQDVISTEKGAMQAAERLGQETAKAASALPPYGSQEGPDLQDVLTQSSNLLGQLANAFSTYTQHSASIRTCFKRIREREEALDELKRRRKSTGSKAEAAEKKLAKMGPENKGLPQQTELLERLRTEMRQMDSDIVVEDSKVGDFKRQMIKEAMSFKFGGLEELGEKICIIGELGKLLIEEVPLEETPPGYGRAPYTGYDKTESAVNEANKCLSTVRFVAGSAGPKPPGLPPHDPIGPLQNSPDPSRINAAEQYGHYPSEANGDHHSSVDFKGKGRDYGLDEANPYGGFDNPYDRATGRYPRYDDGGSVNEPSAQGGQVVWQGPTEEALRAHTQQHEADGRQDYEYEQQKQMDAENAAWRDGEPQAPQVPTVHVPTPDPGPQIPPPDLGSPRLSNPALEPEQNQGYGGPSTLPPGAAAADHLQRPWEPLNVRRDRANSPAPVSLQDGPARTEASPRPRPISQDPLSGIGAMMTSTDMDDRDEPAPQSNRPSMEQRDAPLPPPTFAGESDAGSRTGFYTPTGGATPESNNEYFQPPPRGQMPVPGRVGSPSIPLPPPMPAAAPPRSSSPGPSHSQNPSISIPPAPVNLPPASSYTPTSGGKISAAAFRRPKPQGRISEGMDITSPISPTYSTGTPPVQNGANGGRKLPMPPGPGGIGAPPIPPGRPETPIEANFALPASPPQPPTALAQRQRESGSFADLEGEASPPPVYHDESLR